LPFFGNLVCSSSKDHRWRLEWPKKTSCRFA